MTFAELFVWNCVPGWLRSDSCQFMPSGAVPSRAPLPGETDRAGDTSPLSVLLGDLRSGTRFACELISLCGCALDDASYAYGPTELERDRSCCCCGGGGSGGGGRATVECGTIGAAVAERLRKAARGVA